MQTNGGVICSLKSIGVKRAWAIMKSKYFRRTFSSDEMQTTHKRAFPQEGLAARFAAKLAFSKLMKYCGYEGEVRLSKVEILNQPTGKPFIRIHDPKLLRYSKKVTRRLSVSLSHTRVRGFAVVCLELKSFESAMNHG